MQIDFAGDALWLTDKRTGEVSKVVILVCVLPYSGLGFAKAMYNASMENFFGGISDAFSHFGGTTRIAKSDNMKQWVKKYDRYGPEFNVAAGEWAAYYNTSLQTCRVRTPRDKGAVEGLVQKVYNAVYAQMHDEVFYDLNSMNSRIYELMDAFNHKPSKTTGKSRMDVFESEERLSLISKLRYTALMEDVICGPERNFTKDDLTAISDCSFIRRHENLLIQGKCGCSKSFLACTIGRQACMLGYRTLYLNMNSFVEKIALSKLDGSYLKLITGLEKNDLIIWDDFGLQPMDEKTRLAMLQILEERYERKSVIIASQLPIAKWYDYIGNPTLADAIMDRLVANASKIELKGDSMRQKLKK